MHLLTFNHSNSEFIQPKRRELNDRHHHLTSNRRFKKKARKSENFDFMLCLPQDLVNLIFNSLDSLSLVRIGRVSMSLQQRTITTWKKRKIKDHLNFEWAMCKKKSNPDMSEYFINQALERYIIVDKYHLSLAPNRELAQKINSKFRGLIEHFPILNAYIGHDIARLEGSTGQLVNAQVQEEFDRTILKAQYAGEMLLQGLILTKSNEPCISIIQQYFEQAIEKKATNTGLLILNTNLKEVVASNFLQQIDSMYLDLAIKAASQQDGRALYQLLEERKAPLAKYLYLQGYCFYYLLLFLADIKISENELQIAEEFIDESLPSIKDQKIILINEHFLNVLLRAASLKYNLNKWEEADILFTQVLAVYDASSQSAPADVLVKAVVIKGRLDLFPEADTLSIQALAAYDAFGQSAPAYVLANAAEIKRQLELSPEADRFYTQALASYDASGQSAPTSVLANAAEIKLNLKQFPEADTLSTQALVAYNISGESAPAHVLANAALIKLHLKQFPEADTFSTQALIVYNTSGESAPAHVLANAALTKLQLKQFSEADTLYIQALATYGASDQPTPADVLANAELTKLKLNNFP